MKLLAAAILTATTCVACGGGPTAPTAVASTGQQSNGVANPPPAPAPAPAPAPTPGPGPEPTPPTPAPAPVPPSETWSGTAHTEDSRWNDPSSPLAESFAVKFDRNTITFGSLTTPVLLWNEENSLVGVFGRPNGSNLQIVFDRTTGKGNWTLDGVPGNATGSLTLQKQ